MKPARDEHMINTARALLAGGLALTWLDGKAPRMKGWQKAPSPCKSPDEFIEEYRPGNNLGMRTGAIPAGCARAVVTVDLDLSTDTPRHRDEAMAVIVRALGGELAARPSVHTGSGRGMHWHFEAHADDVPGFARRVIAKSAETVQATRPDGAVIYDAETGRAKTKAAWQVEVLATGAQVVIPPSVHPDTGIEYAWGNTADRLHDGLPVSLLTEITRSRSEGLRDLIVKDSGMPAGGSALLTLPTLNVMGIDVTGGAGTGPRTGMFNNIGQHEDIPHDVALSALNACDPDAARGQWLRTVWAAQAAGVSEQDTAAWSAQSDKFDSAQFSRDWHSFNPARTGGITAGTLLHEAGQRGWRRAAAAEKSAVAGQTYPADRVAQGADARADNTPATSASTGPLMVFSAEGGAIHNGRALAAHHAGRLRWSDKDKAWAVFDGVRWLVGGDAAVDVAAQATADAILSVAVDQAFADGWSRNSTERVNRAKSLHRSGTDRQEMLRASRVHLLGPALVEYDTDPWTLCCPNGIVDLRTGHIRPATPDDLVTRCTAVPFVADAECPQWARFLHEVFATGDNGAELLAFVRRMCGLLATGSVEPECLFVWHGTGANGKSVLGKVLADLLGDYSAAISAHLLRKGQGSESEAERAKLRLVGTRLGAINELEEGERWSSSRLKEMVSRDDISARRLYGEAFEFKPTCKLVVRTNYLPVMTDETDGAWRRIVPIPFTRTFTEEERDPQLAERLVREEGAGILRWMIDAAGDYYRSGEKIDVPAFLRAEVGEIRASMSNFSEFITQHLVRSEPAEQVRTDSVWKHWMTYAKFNNIAIGSKQLLGRKLRERGVRTSTDKRHYDGWKLAPMPSEWLFIN